jgi:predicted DNA-binding antitoxin AbrB/MazE fold protein
MTIRATYEHGILRPVEPLNLEEGQMVSVIVTPETAPWSADRAIAAMERIVAMPVENNEALDPADPPVSHDVDRYLYGDRSEFAQKKAP